MTRAARTSALAAALLACALLAAGGSSAASSARKFTLYAVPTTVQFMNHADDRLRGITNNPFAVNAKALVIVTKGKEKGNGPFPGDDVLYSFKLYSDSSLKKSPGSAIFTCYFDFSKHAICDAYFDLNGDTLLASGSVLFASTRFTLALTGGTNTYLGAEGQVNAVPGPKQAQRLDFQLS